MTVITPETQRPGEMIHDTVHLRFVGILWQHFKVLVPDFRWSGKGYGYNDDDNQSSNYQERSFHVCFQLWIEFIKTCVNIPNFFWALSMLTQRTEDTGQFWRCKA